MILDISHGAEDLWKYFSPKVGNQLCKAQKSGLAVQVDGAELLNEFYRPFTVNMMEHVSHVHHPKFFTEIFRVICNNISLALIYEGKKMISGLITPSFYLRKLSLNGKGIKKCHF